MNILLISSSPHKAKSRTFMLANEVVRGLSPGINTEVVRLCDSMIEFCRHCERCHLKILDCPIKDGAGAVIAKMLDADGIILATPNYINQVTASMKALFDRASHFIHCKRLLGKYIAGVVTSGSGQDGEVLDYLKYYANACGAQYAGGVSSGAPVDEKKKGEAFKLGESLFTAIKYRIIFNDQVKPIEAGKERFKILIEKRKDEWLGEYQYWKNKGW